MTSEKSSSVLWAPWRMDYILAEKEPGCIFCTKPGDTDDKSNLILHRGDSNFVIMNRYPYNNGHLMVVPYRHLSDFELLSEPERSEMMRLVSKSIGVLKKAIRPDGYNIGMNIGKCGGAGIDEHVHFHIVPRWEADTNFMPVVGHTKVISEGLQESWEKLISGFSR